MTWLFLDCNYLCHRAWYAFQGLQHGDLHTGVVYGFLQDIISLQDLHNTNRFAFCFDFGKRLLRQRDYPAYKSNRQKERSEEDEALYSYFQGQVKNLRRTYLKELGYRNIFWQEGYEADDIIASLCLSSLGRDDKAIIVSADHDMYQLLDPRVSIWSPREKKYITESTFTRDYGVSPTQWVDVKAIAGCSSDCIEGIQGVGEITAAKFINGSLKPTAKAFDKIVRGNDVWIANRFLVKLPYPGCSVFKLRKDSVIASSWQELTSRLGMKSIQDKAPGKRSTKRQGFGLI